MQLGVTLVPEDAVAYGSTARAAEEMGAQIVGVPDSQASTFRECYLTLGEVARQTSSVTLGPLVTNPITRHPLVTATAMATLNEVSGGRAICGVGTGYSAVKSMGLPPATLAQLAAYVSALRQLLSGRSAEYDGQSLTLTWHGDPVPVYVAANGFRTMELAGELADGVILGGALTDEAIAYALKRVATGAQRAGKSLNEVPVWCFARCSIGTTREAALHAMRRALASAAGSHVFKPLISQGLVPKELVRAFEEYHVRYDVRGHVSYSADEANVELLDSLGLRSYVADMVALAGTEEECVVKLRRLDDLGIHGVLLYPGGDSNTEAVESIRGLLAEPWT